MDDRDKEVESETGGTPPDTNEPVEERSPETVRILDDVLGLFGTPETGPESELEIKARRDLNDVVHRMLVVGLVISTVVLFVGLALSAISHHPLPARVLGFREMLDGLKRGSAPSVLSLGILLLIATPPFRVIGSLIEFLAKRDWRYAGITFLVLLILAASLIAGGG